MTLLPTLPLLRLFVDITVNDVPTDSVVEAVPDAGIDAVRTPEEISEELVVINNPAALPLAIALTVPLLDTTVSAESVSEGDELSGDVTITLLTAATEEACTDGDVVKDKLADRSVGANDVGGADALGLAAAVCDADNCGDGNADALLDEVGGCEALTVPVSLLVPDADTEGAAFAPIITLSMRSVPAERHEEHETLSMNAKPLTSSAGTGNCVANGQNEPGDGQRKFPRAVNGPPIPVVE